MDDLLSEFLVETSNRLAKLDGDIGRFADAPDNGATQAALIDLFHTMTSASGFLALNRLEAISQSVEDLLGRMQSGAVAAGPAAGAVVVDAIDVIRKILRTLATSGVEPSGDDMDLMVRLLAARSATPVAEAPRAKVTPPPAADPLPVPQDDKPVVIESREPPSVSLPAVTNNVSLPLERLDSFAGLVGQLVQTRNNLNHLMRDRDDAELEESIQRLSYITSDLGANIVATRRQALGQAGTAAGETPGSFDIVTAVTVSCGGRRFAIPQRNVLELVWVTPTAGLGTANDEFRYLRLRDKRLPWIRLSTILQTDMDRALARRREIVVMMQAGEETIGLSVEQVFDAEEIVLRAQPPLLASIGLYLGNTILGDGSVAMVLDPLGILTELRNRQQRLIGERTASPALPPVQG